MPTAQAVMRTAAIYATPAYDDCFAYARMIARSFRAASFLIAALIDDAASS